MDLFYFDLNKRIAFFLFMVFVLNTNLVAEKKTKNLNLQSDEFSQAAILEKEPQDLILLDSLMQNPTKGAMDDWPPLWNIPVACDKVAGIIVYYQADPRVNEIPIAKNDYIGAFYLDDNGEYKCGGAGAWPDSIGLIFTAFMDNLDTPEKDGFSYGEEIHYRLFSWEYMAEYDVDQIALRPDCYGNFWYPLTLVRLIDMVSFEDLRVKALADPDMGCNEASISLDVEITNGSGDFTYLWSSDPPGYNSDEQNPQFTITESTTFMLEASDGINTSRSMRPIYVAHDPAAFAGDDISTCAIGSISLNGQVSNLESLIWVSSGDGTFSDSCLEQTEYYLGENDMQSTSLSLTLEGSPNSPCTFVAMDTLDVVIFPTPYMSLQPNFSTCINMPIELTAEGGNLGDILWETGGNGTFSHPDSLTTTYYHGSYGNSHSYIQISLTVAGVDPCNLSIVEETQLAVNKPAYCSAGNNISICHNETFITNGQAVFYSTAQWNTSGDGTFADSSTLKTLYTPGEGDIQTGQAILSLTVTSIAPCPGQITKNMVLSINSGPEVDAGDNIGACGSIVIPLDATASNYSSLLWSTGGNGTFENIDQLDAIYHASMNDNNNGEVILTLEASPQAPCTMSSSDDVLVNFEGGATANAGTDISICETGQAALQGSANDYISLLWSSSGDGTFSSVTSLSTIYSPGTGDISLGQAVLTLTPVGTPPCEFGLSDNTTIFINKNPTCSAGSDFAVCAGENIELNASSQHCASRLWETSSDGTFENANSWNAIYHPGNQDINNLNVELQFTAFPASPCNLPAIDVVNIEILPAPEASAGANRTICESDILQLDGEAINASSHYWISDGDGTFANEADLHTSYTPGQEDMQNQEIDIYLNVSGMEGCGEEQDSFTLYIQANPGVEAGAEKVCPFGVTTTIDQAQVSDKSAVLWTIVDGNGIIGNPANVICNYTPNGDDLEQGMAKLTLTAIPISPCLASVLDTLTLHIVPDCSNAVAFAGDDMQLCADQTDEIYLENSQAQNLESVLWTSDGDGFFDDDTILHPKYTAGENDLLNGEVVLCITAYASAPCQNASDCLTILFQDLPEAIAGSDQTLCSTNSLQLNGIGNNASSYSWTTGGDGTFTNKNSLTSEYVPGNNDITNGLVDLCLTASGLANCGDAYSCLSLTIIEAPSADAGSDYTACGQAGIPLFGVVANNNGVQWTSTGNGAFSQDNVLTPIYFPGSSDMDGLVELCITAFGQDGCDNAIDCMQLHLISEATANAGADATICKGLVYKPNGEADHFASLFWETNGDGTFDDPTQLSPVYMPGSNDEVGGGVTLTLTAASNGTCASSISEMILTIQPQALAFAGNDASILRGEFYELEYATATNNASVLWTTSGSGTFNSSDTLNAVYHPCLADEQAQGVNLTLTAMPLQPCELARSDDFYLSILDACQDAIANAGNDISTCDYTAIVLNGTAENQTSVLWVSAGDGTFSAPTSLNTIYYPGEEDVEIETIEISLTAFAALDCADSTDMLNISFFEAATVYAGEDQIICNSQNLVSLTGLAQNYSSIIWTSTGTGNFFPPNNLNTHYNVTSQDKAAGEVFLILTASSAQCANVSDTLRIAINEPPIVFVNNGGVICGNETFTTGGFAMNYSSIYWTSTGDGTFDDSTLMEATYFPGSADIENGDAELCLSAVANEGCDNASECLYLEINSSAYANSGADQTICETATSVSLIGEATDYDNILWESDGDGEFTNNSQLITSYIPGSGDKQNGQLVLSLTAFSSSSCGDATSEMLLTIDAAPTANAGANQTICETTSVSLSGIAQNAASTLWTTNGDGSFDDANIIATTYYPGVSDIAAGEVNISLTANANGVCADAVDFLNLIIQQTPEANAGSDQNICESEIVNLVGEADFYSNLTWMTMGGGTFDNQNTLETTYYPCIQDLSNGQVELCFTASGLSNCSDITDCVIIYFQKPPSAYAGQDDSISYGDVFNTSLAAAQNYAELQWTSTGSGTIDDPASLHTSYSPSDADFQTEQIELSLYALPLSPCESGVFDNLTLALKYNGCYDAYANAGEDAALCLGDVYTLGGEASNHSAVLWTSNGDGTFDNENDLAASYTPGIQDIQIGSIMLCLEAFASDTCANAIDCMELSIQDLPQVFAGSDNTISLQSAPYVFSDAWVQNQTGVMWSTLNGLGAMVNENSIAASYYASPTDIDQEYITFLCAASPIEPCMVTADDFVNIKFTMQCSDAVVDAGSDIGICVDNETMTVSLSGFASNYTSLLWTSSGDGSFDFSNVLHPVYTLGMDDINLASVTLNLFAQGGASCQSASDDVLINIYPLPLANAGQDMTICGQAGIPLFGGASNFSSVKWTSNGDGFFIQDDVLDPIYFPGDNDMNGAVELCLTAFGQADCDAATDCILINLIPEATVNAGADATICAATSYNLNAEAGNFSSLLWTSDGDGTFDNPTLLSSAYTPGSSDEATGETILTLTAVGNGTCADAMSTMMLTILPLPQAYAGEDTIIEQGASYTLASATATNQSSVLWSSSGSGAFANPLSLYTVYYPSVADEQAQGANLTLTAMPVEPCVLSDSDEFFLAISDGCEDAVADAGNDITTCNNTAVALIGTAQNQTGVSWTTEGDGSFSAPESLNTIYYPGAQDLDDETIEITLTAFAFDDCADDTDLISISFFEPLIVDVGGDRIICNDVTLISLSAFAQNYTSLAWTSSGTGGFYPPNSLNPHYNVTSQDKAAGEVFLILTASSIQCGSVSDTLKLQINEPPLVIVNNGSTICGNESFTTGGFAMNYSSLYWTSSGNGTFENATHIEATYFPGAEDIQNGYAELCLTAVSEEGCDNVSACLYLEINSSAHANAGADQTICETTAQASLNGEATDYDDLLWESEGDGSFVNDSELATSYIPGSADKQNGQVVLSLTAYSSSSCGDATSEMLLTIDAAPLADAGADQTVCETTAVNLSGTVQNAASVVWNTSGDGSFDDANILATSYYPGVSDITTGEVNISLTANGNSACADAGDFLNLILQQAPQANAGSNQTICESEIVTLAGDANNYATVLWETSGDGEFSDANVLSPTYSPGVNDNLQGNATLTFTAISGSTCSDATSQMLLTIDTAPVANAGADQTVCETATVNLNGNAQNAASIVWNTSGDGSFDDANILATSYYPGVSDIAAGEVIISLTAIGNGACGDAGDFLNLIIQQAPQANAGSNQTICESEIVTLAGDANNYATVLWETSGDGEFSDANVLSPTYSPGVNDVVQGNATLGLTAFSGSTCSDATSEILLTIDTAPVANAGADQTVCETATVSLNGNTQNAVSVVWSSTGDGAFSNINQLAPVYYPGALDISNGAVELCIKAKSNGICAHNTDCMSVIFQLVPEVVIPEEMLVCAGSSLEIIATGNNYSALTWTSQGDGTFGSNGLLTNTYYPGSLDITNGVVDICLSAIGMSNCESVSECANIEIIALPEVFAGSDQTICENDQLILTASASNYQDLQWTTSGDGTFDNTMALVGTYFPGAQDVLAGNIQLCLSANGLSGCEGTQDCLNLVLETSPTANAGSDISVCVGENISVSGQASHAGSVLWTSSGDGTFANPEYGNTTYYPGANDYNVMGVDLCFSAFGVQACGETQDSLSIIFQPGAIANAGPDFSVCQGSPVLLSGTASNYSSLYWTRSGDGAFSNPQVLNPTYYPGPNDLANGSVTLCLKANGQNSCGSHTDCVMVSLIASPNIDAGTDQTICESDVAILSASGANYVSVFWISNGDGTFDNPDALLAHYYPGADDIANGNAILCLNALADSPCNDASDCINLTINGNPVLMLDEQIEICFDEDLLLNPLAQNYAGSQWITSGDGTFENENLPQTIYYPGSQDKADKVVELCLTLLGSGSCGEVSSCVTVNIIDLPLAYAGVDATMLSNDSLVLDVATASSFTSLMWTTTGYGSFDDSTDLNTTYHPSIYDATLDEVYLKLRLAQQEPCNRIALDSLRLVVLPNECQDVEVDAGPDDTICEDQSIELTGATCLWQESLLWTNTGDGVFDSPTDLNAKYTPGSNDIQNGSVMLILTAYAFQPCSDNADTMQLFIQSNPVAFAGSNNTIPENTMQYTFADAYAENGSSVFWITGNGMGYLDDEEIINPTYTIAPFDFMQGYVMFTMAVSSYSPCTISADSQLTLYFADSCSAAVVDAGSDIGLCEDETVFALSATAANFSSLQWTSAGDGTFDHPASSQTHYTLGSNDQLAGEIMLYLQANAWGDCSSAIDSVLLSPLVLPDVFAGENQTICQNEACLTDGASASNYSSLIWTTSGDGTFDQPEQMLAQYYPGEVDILNGLAQLSLTAYSLEPCMIPVSASFFVIINTTPELVYEVDDEEVILGEDVLLMAVSRYTDFHQWYGPDGLIPEGKSAVLFLENVSFSDAGYYYCILTNDCGSTLSNQAKLTVYENQIISVPQGWSGFSSFITPFNLSIEEIFEDYPDEFVLIKNMTGIYFPGQNVNTLSLWDPQSGYEINFSQAMDVEIKGNFNINKTVQVPVGWSYMPVISTCPVDVVAMFGAYQSHINMIKEIGGIGVYWPAMGINTLQTLVPGRAYCMRSSQAFEVSFDDCMKLTPLEELPLRRPVNNSLWNDLHFSATTHTIAFDDAILDSFNTGDIIGAFTNSGQCAGYLQLAEGNNVLVLFADDPLTNQIDGFTENERLSYAVYNPSTGVEKELQVTYDVNFAHSDGTFASNGISRIIKASSGATAITMPGENPAISIYPNPSSGQVSISGLNKASRVEVHNSDGQLLRTADKNNFDGNQMMKIDLSGCAAGIVYLRIVNDNQVINRKLILR